MPPISSATRGRDGPCPSELQAEGGEIGAAASAYVTLDGPSQDLLYRASGRGRIAATLVQQAIQGKAGRRVLLFHERVAGGRAPQDVGLGAS